MFEAIRKSSNDRTAAEIELLEQKAVYDHNNPDKEAVIRRSEELVTKRVAAETERRQVRQLEELGRQNEEILRIKVERDTQAMINSEEFEADDSISQALTTNRVVIGATIEDIRLKKMNQAAFEDLMNGNPVLRDALGVSQDTFNGYTRGHQAALLQAIQQGLKGDNTQVGAYDSMHEANLTEVFNAYWETIEPSPPEGPE